MFKRLLVPIDGTDYSWRVLDYACELASLSGGSLVIMTVSHDIHAFAFDGGFGHIGDDVLDTAYEMLQGRNIDCTYLLERDGDVAEQILLAVKEEHCDGIILGSRGLGIVEGFFRSSVSQSVVENANVPVTIVK